VNQTEQIMDVARTLSANVVSLVKLANQRISLLIDPILKRRLVTANETVKNSTQTLVRAMGEVRSAPIMTIVMMALTSFSRSSSDQATPMRMLS